MGLLTHLLAWPVTGPKALVEFSLRQVEGVVHHELTDDDRVKEELLALQMELELGELDEAEYEERESRLIEQLKEARAWRVRLGMEEEWAPMGFASPDGEGPAPSSSGSLAEPGDTEQ
jgi:hypothetical protein